MVSADIDFDQGVDHVTLLISFWNSTRNTAIASMMSISTNSYLTPKLWIDRDSGCSSCEEAIVLPRASIRYNPATLQSHVTPSGKARSQ